MGSHPVVQNKKKGEGQMQIAEMRSALEANHNKNLGALPVMPAWAVRRIFEKRSGLSLTPLPHGVEVRSLSSIVAARHVASLALATESEREAVQSRIRATQLAFLK